MFFQKNIHKKQKKAPRLGRPVFLAAAIVVATAAVLLAAAAEQDQQNDDPAQITTAEAVVTKVTHKDTSKDFLMWLIATHPML
jgi:Na+-transporting NADH:ubiquinone oxidoreductase subunit NqrC